MIQMTNENRKKSVKNGSNHDDDLGVLTCQLVAVVTVIFLLLRPFLGRLNDRYWKISSPFSIVSPS